MPCPFYLQLYALYGMSWIWPLQTSSPSYSHLHLLEKLSGRLQTFFSHHHVSQIPTYVNHALPPHGSLRWGQEVVGCLFGFFFFLLQLILHLLPTILSISLGVDEGWGARWREKHEAQEGLS